MTDVAEYINEMKRLHENAVKVQEILNNVVYIDVRSFFNFSHFKFGSKIPLAPSLRNGNIKLVGLHSPRENLAEKLHILL